MWRGDLFDWLGLFLHRCGLLEPGDLAVGHVTTSIAHEDRVFSDGGQVHEFVGHLSAHHTHVRSDRDDRQAATVKDVKVGLIVGPILGVQAFPVHVQAVAVLHGELSYPDQPGAWAGVIAPLGLDVVHEAWQLLVGLYLGAQQAGDDFLVGHCQDHIALVLVVEARHFRTDLVPSSGFLPDVGRMDDGHRDLLPTDRVHLLAQDVLDLGY